MTVNRTCSYSFKEWKCPRPIWTGGSYLKDRCLFHDVRILAKKEQFNEELKLIFNRTPSILYKKGEREGFENGDFLGFIFSEEMVVIKDIEFRESVDLSCIICNELFINNCKIPVNLHINQPNIKTNLSVIMLYDISSLYLNNINLKGSLGLHFITIINSLFVNNLICNKAITLHDITSKKHLFIKDIYSNRSISLLHLTNPNKIELNNINAKKDILIDKILLSDVRILKFKCDGKLKFNNSIFVRHHDLFDSIDLPVENVNKIEIQQCDISGIKFYGLPLEKININDINMKSSRDNIINYIIDTTMGIPTERIWDDYNARLLKIKKIKDKKNIFSDIGDYEGYFAQAEGAYTELKRKMAERQKWDYYYLFRAGELEMKLCGKTPLKYKIFIWLYRFFNGYGIRWVRALIFWLLSIIIFATGAYLDQPTNIQKYDPVSKSYEWVRQSENLGRLDVLNSIRHSFEVAKIIGDPYHRIDNSGTRFLEGIQRIVSPFLLFMLAQAIRNRVRG